MLQNCRRIDSWAARTATILIELNVRPSFRACQEIISRVETRYIVSLRQQDRKLFFYDPLEGVDEVNRAYVAAMIGKGETSAAKGSAKASEMHL